MLDNWRHSSSSLTSQASSTHHSFKDDFKSIFRNDLDELDDSLKTEHFSLSEVSQIAKFKFCFFQK